MDSLSAKLADLQGHIPGMHGFDGGVSVSPEGLEQGFRHGFSIDFDDAAACDAYLARAKGHGRSVGLVV
ncbi:Dabb family protein [Thalassospira sp. SN3W]|uniref:Dabb family protein n=1 Tax=Thalassospira sp. SN3W TaxID=3035476 RepID=UPI00311B0748